MTISNGTEIKATQKFLLAFYLDINECEINNGGCDQKCLNTAGTYQCDCFGGFIYNSTTKECKG